MNRHVHRVVFNKARGLLMAVSETAKSCGAGGARKRSARRSAAPASRTSAVAFAVWACFALPAVRAQIIADPSAPPSRQATVLMDAGRPLVNIQTPSTGGVSHNTYRQFDVQANGVVLNNSRHSNPWLAGGEASVILNEVNSNNPSYLRGAITVNGSRAQVVVANPSGIQIDGASFVNASRATLTTGVPIFQDDDLKGFRVQQGIVNVTGQGLNVKGVGYTEILSRAATIAARIKANSDEAIAVYTGPQTVDYATGQVSGPAEGLGPVPAFAIDSSALGGMYAGSISLLATEAGVGVRNAGAFQAQAKLVITADGRLENKGQMQARVASLGTVDGDILNTGSLKAQTLLTLSAGGSVRLEGVGMEQDAAYGSAVLVHSARDIDVGASAILGSTAEGGSLSLSAGGQLRLGMASELRSHGKLRLESAGMVSGIYTKLSSLKDAVTVLAKDGIDLAKSQLYGANVHLESGAPFQSTNSPIKLVGGNVLSSGDFTAIATGDLVLHSEQDTTASFGAWGRTHLETDQNLTVTGETWVSGAKGVTIIAGKEMLLDDRPRYLLPGLWGASIKSSSDLRISAGTARLLGGYLSAGGALLIEAYQGDARLNLRQDQAIGSLLLNATGDLSVVAYAGDILADNLSAYGNNISLLSNGAIKVRPVLDDVYKEYATEGSYSQLVAREDVTVGSVKSSAEVDLRGTKVTAGGQVTVAGMGNVRLGGVNKVAHRSNGPVFSATRSAIQAGAVHLQGNKLDVQRMDINADGDVVLGADQGLTSIDLNASAGGNFWGISNAGNISTYGNSVKATGMLGWSADGYQAHEQGAFSAGAISLFTDLGGIGFRKSRLSTNANVPTALQALAGQVALESGGGMLIDAGTSIAAAGDLSIVTGMGDIALYPVASSSALEFERPQTVRYLEEIMPLLSGTWGAVPALELVQSQFNLGRGLTLAAREGTLSLTGQAGTNGFNSSRRINFDLLGDIRLIGRQLRLDGSKLRTTGNIAITATDGAIDIRAIKTTAAEYGFTNSYWDRAEFAASRGIDIQSAGDVTISGLWAHTWGRAQVLSGGSLSLSGVYNQWRYQSGTTYQEENYLTESSVTGAQGVTLGAFGGHLMLNGVDVISPWGTVRLQALRNVVIEAAPEHSLFQSSSTQVERKWYGKKKTTTFTNHNESLIASPVWLDGQNIEIKAGSKVLTYATQMSARGDLYIEAGDDAEYRAVQDVSYNHSSVSKTSSLWGFNYKDSTISDSRQLNGSQVTVHQSLGSIVSLSGGDQTLQGTVVSYGGTATYKPGVGEKARADARVILEGVVDSINESRTFESDSVMWVKQSGEGKLQETLKLPQFKGPHAPVFDGPVLVDIPAGEFTTQIASLSQQPGMAYLKDLGQRRDVNWRPVQLAFDQWKYDQEGLSGAGAAIVAVAVAWATSGMGAGLVGASTTSVTGVMASAAFSSLAAQAAITFINNKGDIGKTLSDLAKSDVAKAAVAAALTAGVLNQLASIPQIQVLQGSEAFADKLTFNLINAGGRALTTTAIEGGDLEDALRGAILGGLVDTVHGSVAGQIKGMEAGYLAHKLAHALAGCVAGAAAGGECRDGAIGAAVGEVVAELFKGQQPNAYASDGEWKAYDAKVLAYSKIVAGGIAAYAGGDAQTAITTAEVAVNNNFLKNNRYNARSSQWASFKQELDICKTTAGCDVNAVYSRWQNVSNDQQRQAMGIMDALFAANPSEASEAGAWFGQAVSSLYVRPTDVCTTTDSRCIQFVQQQQNQAMAVFRSGLATAYANDLVDGGGRTKSSLLETPPVGAKASASDIHVTREAAAYNIALAKKLADDLRIQSANSPFTLTGGLTDQAINSAKPIAKLGPGQLSNPAIPPDVSKYSTDLFQSPAGDFQVHFYKNPVTGAVLYDLDYKIVFRNSQGVSK